MPGSSSGFAYNQADLAVDCYAGCWVRAGGCARCAPEGYEAGAEVGRDHARRTTSRGRGAGRAIRRYPGRADLDSTGRAMTRHPGPSLTLQRDASDLTGPRPPAPHDG